MTEKKVQASTLKTMPLSPPAGGRRVPKGFNPYNGTKEEEIETLKMGALSSHNKHNFL
jgi:hypothetical protein